MYIFRIFILLLVAFSVCTFSATEIFAQIEGQEKEEKLSDKSRAESEARENRIKQELSQLKNHEWAGEYHYGDGLGVNVNLLIAPTSGFVFTWYGCLGLYDLNYGDVSVSNRNIKLLFTHQNKREGFQGIAEELIPVLWGERHYLIASDEVIEFANDVNYGFEPSSKLFGSKFLLRVGDEEKHVKGQPNIPSQFSEYLLKKPIRTKITAVGESRVETSKSSDDLQFRITSVTLDVGSAKGARVGMEFHVYSPSRVSESAKITKVGQDFSEAEIVQIGLEDQPPSTEWKLSTTIRDIK